MAALVSIVLLNWNGEQHVHRCMEHVTAQSYGPLEIIIVDNGSRDGSLQKLKARYPDATYIENPENRGYSAGTNQGIAATQGTFVLPLNQDACLHSDFVAECVRAMQQDETIGAIGGRVLAWVGDELTSDLRKGEGERTTMRKRFQTRGGEPLDGPSFVLMPAGGFAFFRRATLDDIREASGSWFDESFGTGWEDLDLAFRMHLRGWKCLFLPTAYGWHVGSGSVGGKATFLGKTTEYQTRVLRNRLFTIYKDLPRPTFLRLLPFLAATEAAMPFYLLLRSPRSLRAWVSAWAEVFGSLPELRQKRRRIQGNLRVPPGYLYQFFDGF